MSQSDYYRGVEAAQQALAATGAAQPATRAAAVHEAMAPWFRSTTLASNHACRIGCDHCCHLPVGITFGEALRLSEALRDLPAVALRAVEAARATAHLAWSDLVALPCPLLHDRACSVHDARPLPCRALASTDADACERGLRGNANVPFDDEAFVRGLGATAALAADSAVAGLRELRSALGAMLAAVPADRPAAFAAARQAAADA